MRPRAFPEIVPPVKIAITGATGFIGRALTALLLGTGHEVRMLSRSAERARAALGDAIVPVEWTPGAPGEWFAGIDGADAIVHVAAEMPKDRTLDDATRPACRATAST